MFSTKTETPARLAAMVRNIGGQLPSTFELLSPTDQTDFATMKLHEMRGELQACIESGRKLLGLPAVHNTAIPRLSTFSLPQQIAMLGNELANLCATLHAEVEVPVQLRAIDRLPIGGTASTREERRRVAVGLTAMDTVRAEYIECASDLSGRACEILALCE